MFTDSVEDDVSSVFDVDEDSDLLGEVLISNMMETDNPDSDSLREVLVFTLRSNLNSKSVVCRDLAEVKRGNFGLVCGSREFADDD
jgi:hypothetical protein